jgi:hypothetical protein
VSNHSFWVATIKSKFSKNKQINLAIEVKYKQFEGRLQRSTGVKVEDASDSLSVDLVDYIRSYVERNMNDEEIINAIVDGQIDGLINIEELDNE